jgi:hypothetical protein
MHVPDYYSVLKVSKSREREITRKAEANHRLRQAGVEQRGWMAQQACKLVSAAGGMMVALGRRMERSARTPVARPARLPRASGA